MQQPASRLHLPLVAHEHELGRVLALEGGRGRGEGEGEGREGDREREARGRFGDEAETVSPAGDGRRREKQ